MSPADLELVAAKVEAERAKRRLVAVAASLQERLRPANLASDAWDGVREKSGEMAEGAIQAVRDRPVKASGVLAGLALFLARDSIWSAVSRWWEREHGDDGLTEEPDEAGSRRSGARSKKRGANA